jgi:hypothetical protein
MIDEMCIPAMRELVKAAQPFSKLIGGQTLNDPVTAHTVTVSGQAIHDLRQALIKAERYLALSITSVDELLAACGERWNPAAYAYAIYTGAADPDEAMTRDVAAGEPDAFREWNDRMWDVTRARAGVGKAYPGTALQREHLTTLVEALL